MARNYKAIAYRLNPSKKIDLNEEKKFSSFLHHVTPVCIEYLDFY